MNALRFHVGKLAEGSGSDDEEVWTKLGALVRDALAGPAAGESVDLRRRLEQFALRIPERRLPDDLFGLSRELERVAKAGAHKPAPSKAPPSAIEELRPLLRGRVLLVIGGDPRHQHREKLRDAFELADVLWPVASERNPTIAVFEPLVARPEVALVLLLIKLNRHGVTEELPAMCERHGKPVVRMTAGYNPEQVAAQIQKQVGKRLAGGR